MKKTDKLLIGVVGGIILLVVVAFVVALSTPKPTYRSEDTAEGVAFNYLFALQQQDYERAYGYLSPAIKGYPENAEVFAEDIRDNPWQFGNTNDAFVSMEVESSTITGQRADVSIKKTEFYEGDLFSSNEYTYTFDMTLRQDSNGNWKIEKSDSYWFNCWNTPGDYGCK